MGLAWGLAAFFKLGSKPPWTDEFATILYARGDNYRQIPINKILSPSSLLEPLQGFSENGFHEVSQLLIQKNNHPPLYFVIVNIWQHLFPLDANGYISIYGVRSLSVIFGILGIVGIYWVAKIAFRSATIAQISAALMAGSPFGIYLAQEARHYTLIILVAIASLGYCFHFINSLTEKKQLSALFVLSWLGLNIGGLLIHYFFVLTLIAEAIALGWLILNRKFLLNRRQWLQLSFVVIGMIIFGLIWIFQVLPNSYGSTMTDWIRLNYADGLDLIFPIGQLLFVITTMIFLLPIQANLVAIILVSGMIMVVVSLRLVIFWNIGIQHQLTNKFYQAPTFFLNRFVLISLILFSVLTYGLGVDITRGARYSFVYFPAIILLVAVGISDVWQRDKGNFLNVQKIFFWFPRAGSQAIALILCLSFLGGITVVNNWGYQKPYDPASIIQQIEAEDQPALILTAHKSTVQIGEMMGIAWEKHRRSSDTPLFFAFVPYQINQKDYRGDITRLIAQFPDKTFNLWTLNLTEKFTPQHCELQQRTHQAGYYGHIYRCQKEQN